MSKEAMKLALDFAIMHHTDAGYTEVRYAVQSALREALAEQPAPATWTPEDELRPQDIRVEMYPPQPTSGMVVGMSKGVRLIHTPTGTIVECDTERSQHRNREVALKKLKAALAEQPLVQQEQTAMDAITALREALAEQPAQQEPVALKWQQAPVKTRWGDDMVVASVAIDKDHTVCLYCERDQAPKVETMFAQRTWVGLTVAEMEELTLLVDRMDYTRMLQLAGAKLKEKNTP